MQIGIFKGDFQYDAVNVFADHLGAACARAGVTPYIIDLNTADSVCGQLTRWLANQPDMLGFVGFNGICLYERVGGDEVRVGAAKPFAAWLVDHPIRHLPRIAKLARDLIVTIDSGHEQFLRDLGLPHVAWIPHGGCATAAGGPEGLSWQERPIRFFMPGSLGNPDDTRRRVMTELEGHAGPQWAALYASLAGDAKVASDRELLGLARHEARTLGLPEGLSAPFCYVLDQAMMTLRHQRRLEILRALDENGVAVDLAGKGCGDFGFRHHRVLPVADFSETLNRFQKSRFVLHINPLFWEALHERAAYAAMAGAVLVTDGNRMLKRELSGGRGVVFDPVNVQALGERLERLERTGEGAGMASKGQRLMESRHTWDHRAAALIRALKEMTGREHPKPQTSISALARRSG